ncbi:hypothetical protein F5Y03DRAFT_402019 [Xylaria venustula]|nr:hypothetical protein F5Y03DRAFT_402019 [Xylaria venustula]
MPITTTTLGDYRGGGSLSFVHKPNAPELLDGKATDRRFHALGSAVESRTQNKLLMLGRLFAAAMSQQVALKNLWELPSRRLPLNSSEPLVESIMEPLTVRIDCRGLTQPVTWWVETDNSRDEWIQRFNGNVAEVLVPVIQAWKLEARGSSWFKVKVYATLVARREPTR